MIDTIMRRALGFGAVALAAIALAAPASAQKTKLTVYTAIENEQLEPFKKAFEADNPTIEIAWVRDSTGVITAKLIAEKDNPRADVIWGLAASSVGLKAGMGMIEPYTPANAARVYREIASRLAAVPGVQSVVSTNRLPLGRGPTNTLVIEGYVSPTGTNTTEVSSAAVSANYFDALGIRILHGRAFRPQDNFTAPPVAIVSEAMARRYWGTSDVVGRRYSHDGVPDSSVEIVGVVKDVKVASLTEEPRPQFYRPLDQQGGFLVSYIVRSSGDQSVMPGTLSRVVREVDAKLPVLQATTIEDYLTQQLLIPRIGTSILAGFSLTALILAALGLYAVVAVAVGERAREVGIRMALGARGPHVVWMTVRGVMMTVVAGLVVGLVLSIAAAQGMSNVLYRVSPTDPVTLGVVTLVLGLVALVAALIPARRATRVNPLVVLRYQ